VVQRHFHGGEEVSDSRSNSGTGVEARQSDYSAGTYTVYYRGSGNTRT